MTNQRRLYRRLVLIIVPLVGCLTLAQGPDQRKLWNDAYSRLTAENEAFLPNPFLTTIIEDMPPGRALDIAMGQGRNAVMLASRGWEVSGFDISDVAIGQAKALANKVGVKLNAVVADGDQFNYGIDRFDLVVAMYVHYLVTDRAKDVMASLRRGGLIVVEGFHGEALAGVGHETNELLRVFGGSLTVLRYEDAMGQPDPTWKQQGKNLRFIRLVARKD